jgi:ABC-type nitrate/sulfonate/bicarbonate transport system permease component
VSLRTTADDAETAARPRGGRWRRVRERWPVVIGPLVLLGSWETASRTELIQSVFYPPPSAIVTEMAVLADFGEDGLGQDLLITVLRLALVALLAAVVGIAAGLVMSVSRWLNDGLEPVLAFFYPIPTLLFLPLITFVLDRGEAAVILTSVVTPFIVMTFYTSAGVREISPVLLEVGRNYGATGRLFFFRVLLPGALSNIIAGFRISLGLSLITLIAVEMVAASTGLGQVLWSSWQVLAVTDMYVVLVVIAVLGLLTSVGFGFVADRLMPWRTQETGGAAR